ncbi:MAG: hypothetical protein JWP26_3413 [Devosia sp.]|uniref:hypothetical protein n=1 Tax=Devosia sp. TaxID=1871048 RepID=UPI002624E37A|nr:hypothetical protein [Devosia sp.]MDB5588443.1 hypothetical protein [Devosia sp.]
MRKLIGASLFGLMLASPAMADGKIYVQLPDLSSYQGKEAEDFLHQVVLANIVSSNCPGFEATEEEWSLLTDSADILARENLRLSVDAYDADYYQPAFSALDNAQTCEKDGPSVKPILDELVGLGGSREALPDQDAAYEQFSARQASWDAAPAAAPSGKTKTK